MMFILVVHKYFEKFKCPVNFAPQFSKDPFVYSREEKDGFSQAQITAIIFFSEINGDFLAFTFDKTGSSDSNRI